jgi:hypothetical protein
MGVLGRDAGISPMIGAVVDLVMSTTLILALLGVTIFCLLSPERKVFMGMIGAWIGMAVILTVLWDAFWFVMGM